MSNETLFYIFGLALTATALVVSFLGLRSERFPPSGAVFGGVAALFAALVLGTAVFGVANARDEVEHREAEQAEEAAAAEEEAQEQPAGQAGGEGAKPAGEGAILQLAADPEALEFDTTELSSPPGEVTIEFSNPAVIEHDVAILRGDQQLAKSALISEGQTAVSAELEPGEYEFICTVPGHAEAGMQGTLTVE
jgi:plastocyanin